MSETDETMPRNIEPDRSALYAALAKARGEFLQIPRRRIATVKSDNVNYSYKYADLADIFAAVDVGLVENEIAPIQSVTLMDGQMYVKTTLVHSSGQSLTEFYPLWNKDGKGHPAQTLSGAFQMSKRYALCGLLGVSTDESIEGDDSRKVSSAPGPTDIDDSFMTVDGRRMPHKSPKIAPDAKPREIAEAAQKGILNQFAEVKTPVGLNGVWTRNSAFIDKMADKHNDLYMEIFDVFHAEMAKMSGDEPV